MSLSADIQHYMRPGVLQLSQLPPLSLYIHIPWCVRKCPYCDFNSHALRNPLAQSQTQMHAYLKALQADLDAALPLIWGRSVISIFIGGGTPSLMSADQIDELLSMVRARLKLVAGCEITLEANPGTFETDRFAAYKKAGVTRLSIGVQSFNDALLEKIGRIHNAEQALAAVHEAKSAFETFNLDIMYALPGQTTAMLEQELETALSISPPHISIYHLTIEPNTYFAKYPPATPDEDTAYGMLDTITEKTQARGMHRYEISAYAKAGHECQHNRNYWEFGDYLGIGAGAHSKLSFAHRVIRQVRVRDPQRYMQAAEQNQTISQEHEIKRADLPFEYMLNALRLRHGFNLADFQARTGLPLSSIQPGLGKALEKKLIIQSDDGHITATERGFDFLSDLQSLFLPEES